MFSKRSPKLTKKEQQAIADIYARVHAKCMAVAMKITKDQNLAEDAVHGGFLNALLNKEKLFSMPCHNQDAYIVVIVRNKSIDIMRGQKNTESIWYDSGDELLAIDPVLDVVKIHESKEQYKNLVALIKSLPEIYRVVFVMRYLQGLSNEEIAEALGIKKATVAKRLFAISSGSLPKSVRKIGLLFKPPCI